MSGTFKTTSKRALEGTPTVCGVQKPGNAEVNVSHECLTTPVVQVVKTVCTDEKELERLKNLQPDTDGVIGVTKLELYVLYQHVPYLLILK